MEFDPAPVLRALRCPVLAVYGHGPTTDGEGGGEVLAAYRERLADWLGRLLER